MIDLVTRRQKVDSPMICTTCNKEIKIGQSYFRKSSYQFWHKPCAEPVLKSKKSAKIK